MIEFILKTFQYYIEKRLNIKSIDLYMNQFEDEKDGKFQNTQYPKVLVEILPIEFLNVMSSEEQFADLTIKLHVFIEVIEGTNNISKKNNLSKYAILDTFYRQLSMLNSFELPTELKSTKYSIQNLKRTSIEFPNDSGNIKESIITFNCMFYDYTLPDTEFDYTTLLDFNVSGSIDYNI